jgi:hypothetical protein
MVFNACGGGDVIPGLLFADDTSIAWWHLMKMV